MAGWDSHWAIHQHTMKSFFCFGCHGFVNWIPWDGAAHQKMGLTEHVGGVFDALEGIALPRQYKNKFMLWEMYLISKNITGICEATSKLAHGAASWTKPFCLLHQNLHIQLNYPY